MIGKSMQSSLEEKRQKVKSQIEKFLNENKIPYREVKDKYSQRIEINGKLFSANILTIPELDISISKDEAIVIENNEKELRITYYRSFPKEKREELKIKKSEFEIALPGVYYFNNKLVFLF